jgi:hypothetical protein
MEERKFVGIRKEELGVKNLLKNEFGKERFLCKGRVLLCRREIVISTHNQV